MFPPDVVSKEASILLLKHMMPTTTMYMLNVSRTITMTMSRPLMLTIDLNCMFMKAKQVVNPLKLLMMINMMLTLLRMKTMTVTCVLRTIK